MLKANTGSSIHACPNTAGKEAALAAKQGLENVKLAFTYASCAYDLDAMLAGIAEEMPGIPIIGNTSFTGVITPEGYITGADGFVGMMALDDSEIEIGVAAVEKGECAIADGKMVAKKAMEAAGKKVAPTYFYMVASPAQEEFYLKGITEVIGRVPFFGGSAADNSISGEWKLFTDKGSFADGVAVAFFYSKEVIANQYTGAYHETKDRGIITKVNNNRTLVEIDGEPALKKYAAWRGMDVESLKGGALLAEAVLSPLGVKDRLGDLVAIRHPMNGNDDYSMAIGNQLAEGTAVIRMEATVDELIDSTGEQLRELKANMPKAGAYHLVHCGGRRAGIDSRIDEVAEQIIKEADGVPFIVEFTFGEYGYVQDGCNTCGGLMLSFTGMPK
ncbi:MAG: FIST N-terminal domain-containing protein [Lachnospiraceae bacterium]